MKRENPTSITAEAKTMPYRITRKDYMDGAFGHRDFYGAVVKTAGIRFSADNPLIVRCKAALAKGDEHFNTIPLKEWDIYAAGAQAAISRALKEHGDWFSLAGGVCVMKEAARQACEVQS